MVKVKQKQYRKKQANKKKLTNFALLLALIFCFSCNSKEDDEKEKMRLDVIMAQFLIANKLDEYKVHCSGSNYVRNCSLGYIDKKNILKHVQITCYNNGNCTLRKN